MKFELTPQQIKDTESRTLSDAEMIQPTPEQIDVIKEEVLISENEKEVVPQTITDYFLSFIDGATNWSDLNDFISKNRKTPLLSIQITAQDLLSRPEKADGALMWLKAFVEGGDQPREVTINGSKEERESIIDQFSQAANVLNSGVDFEIE